MVGVVPILSSEAVAHKKRHVVGCRKQHLFWRILRALSCVVSTCRQLIPGAAASLAAWQCTGQGRGPRWEQRSSLLCLEATFHQECL